MKKIPKTKRLTTMQEKFVDFYCQDPDQNGADAARRAGYAHGAAQQAAYKLLRNPLVSMAIQARMARMAADAGVDENLVIQGLLKEAQDPNGTSQSRVMAWSWIGRHLRMFTEKIEVDDTRDLPRKLEEARGRLRKVKDEEQGAESA